MKILRPLSWLSTAGMWVSMVAIFTIMVLVTVDVILRNAFTSSIRGSVEMAELLQGVVVFFGIAATLRSGNHIAADFIVERLSLKTQAAMDLVTSLLSLFVFGLMTWALWSIATGPGSQHEISAILGIATQPFRVMAALGVGLMCVEIVRIIVRCITVLRQGPA